MNDYKNPTVDDYLKHIANSDYCVQSDGKSRMICMLADEIKMKNNEQRSKRTRDQ